MAYTGSVQEFSGSEAHTCIKSTYKQIKQIKWRQCHTNTTFVSRSSDDEAGKFQHTALHYSSTKQTLGPVKKVRAMFIASKPEFWVLFFIWRTVCVLSFCRLRIFTFEISDEQHLQQYFNFTQTYLNIPKKQLQTNNYSIEKQLKATCSRYKRWCYIKKGNILGGCAVGEKAVTPDMNGESLNVQFCPCVWDMMGHGSLWPLCHPSSASLVCICGFTWGFWSRCDSVQTAKFISHAVGCVVQVLSDEMVGEPVHEDGLCCCYRHGEVHPQLVSGSSHQPPLCCRLR